MWENMVKHKKGTRLLGGESNPGLPRDRRGYSPLYYRGCHVCIHNISLRGGFINISYIFDPFCCQD